jgi:sterol desaturase/sphingolipid hydroxylase (fatty acid hydroxylase superfamily)
VGWLNDFIRRAGLPRFHHSAGPAEERNYAVTLSLIDVIFGTVLYEPDRVPANLGIAEAHLYPKSNQFWRVMLIRLHQ